MNTEIFQDKRCKDRIDYDVQIMFANKGATNFNLGVMHNFSPGGIFIESERPLKPGAQLNIRAVDSNAVNLCEVKWCHQLTKKGALVYGIGLKCNR